MAIYIKNIPKDIDVTKIRIGVGAYCFDTGDDMEFRVKIMNRLREFARIKPGDRCPYRYLEIYYSPNKGSEAYMHPDYVLYEFNNHVFFDSEFASTVDKDFNIITTKERSKEEEKEWDFQYWAYTMKDQIDFFKKYCKLKGSGPRGCGIAYCPCNITEDGDKDDPFLHQKFAEKHYYTKCCDRIVHKHCQDRKWKTLDPSTCKYCKKKFRNKFKPEVALFLDGGVVYNPVEHFDDEDITEY